MPYRERERDFLFSEALLSLLSLLSRFDRLLSLRADRLRDFERLSSREFERLFFFSTGDFERLTSRDFERLSFLDLRSRDRERDLIF